MLDEPTTGVDPVSRRDFWRILARLQRDGLTLLLTTPYLDEAERCQRVALMDHGRLLSLDTPDALREREPGVAWSRSSPRPRREAVELLRARPDVAEVEAFGERLHATLPRGRRATAARSGARGWPARCAPRGSQVEPARPIAAVARGRLHPADPRRGRRGPAHGGAAHETALVVHGCSLLAQAAAGRRSRAAPAAPDPRRRRASARCAASPTLGQLARLRARRRGRRARGARRSGCPQVDAPAGYTRHSDVPELILALAGPPPRRIFPNIPDNYRARAGAVAARSTPAAASSAPSTPRAASARPRAPGPSTPAGADLVLETTRRLLVARHRRARASACCARRSAPTTRTSRTPATASDVGLAARNEVLAVQVERDRAELARLARRRTRPTSRRRTSCACSTCPPGTRIEPAEPLAAPAADRAPTLEALVASAALAARPSARPSRARVAAARGARARSSRRARLPQVAACGRLRLREPEPPDPAARRRAGSDTWDVGGERLLDASSTAAAPRAAAARAPRAGRRGARSSSRTSSGASAWRSRSARSELAHRAARASRSPSASLEAARENRAGRGRPLPGGRRSRPRSCSTPRSALLRAGLDRPQAPAPAARSPRAALDRAVGTLDAMADRGRAARPRQALRRLHRRRRRHASTCEEGEVFGFLGAQRRGQVHRRSACCAACSRPPRAARRACSASTWRRTRRR